MAIMKMSMEELHDYCDRLDAARGKVNGAEVAGAVEIGPVLCEPVRPPDGASLQALNGTRARSAGASSRNVMEQKPNG